MLIYDKEVMHQGTCFIVFLSFFSHGVLKMQFYLYYNKEWHAVTSSDWQQYPLSCVYRVEHHHRQMLTRLEYLWKEHKGNMCCSCMCIYADTWHECMCVYAYRQVSQHCSTKGPREVDTQAVMKTLHIKTFVFNTVTC